MSKAKDFDAPSRSTPGTHQRGSEKLSRIPVKVNPPEEVLRKPEWIRAKLPSGENISRIKKILRSQKLSSVCEEAACPNLGECFDQGTATFMIMGDICTRRCPFCDVAHGKPNPLDVEEPAQLAEAVTAMGLKYVVITSVDRDDLRDGGANHFRECIEQLRLANPQLKIETLVPDFRGRMDIALEAFDKSQPDVFNHNLETVPRLYRQARPGADYQFSLTLLQEFKNRFPDILTKSGIMLGLGESIEEVVDVMQDLRSHGCDMLTLGQYLQPSKEHLPVARYAPPEEFEALRVRGELLGFKNIASGPMVRSSYHADLQANPSLKT